MDSSINSISAYMELDDYQELHITIHKNKQCEAHWKNNLRQYTHRSKPLFDKFTSLDSLRFVFARKIDVRDWKLHLTGLKGHYGNSATLTHNGSFIHVCKRGDLDIVRAMVERTQVDLEEKDDQGETPLLMAAFYGHLRVVKYLNEHGADKEARDDDGRTPLLWAVQKCHLSVMKYLCQHVSRGLTRMRGCNTRKRMTGMTSMINILVRHHYS